MPRTSTTRTHEMIMRYQGGASACAIANDMRADVTTVTRVLQHAGATLRGGGKLNALTRAIIVDAYTQGASMNALAIRYEVTPGAIRGLLIRRGVTLRHDRGGPRRCFTAEQIAEMLRLYEAGKSLPTIAAAFDTSEHTIRDRLAEHGASPIRDRRGPRHWAWRGGRWCDTSGYILTRLPPSDPMAVMSDANGRVKEHRLVMARQIGRPLHPWESVHHLNGDRADNRPENLQLRTGKHGNGAALRCRACGSHDIEPVPLGGH